MDAIIKWFTDISNYLNGVFIYYRDLVLNAINSTIDFIKDLPVLILDVLFEILQWLLDAINSGCGNCFTSLDGKLASSMLAMATGSDVSQTVVYCLNQVGFVQALQVVGFGAVIWSVRQLIKFVRG